MVHVGALIDRAPGRKYTAALRFAEFAPRTPLPRPGGLASLRAGLPADFVLALRAPRSSVVGARGALRMDAELEAGLTWLTAAADALQARAVVLNTPADLTPGARSRDLLREYVSRLPRVPGRSYVWLAQGVWEPADIQLVCNELQLVRGFDPLETLASPGPIAYATLRALGHRAGFSLSALADALERTIQHGPEEAFVTVDADRSFDIAKRLTTLLQQAGELQARERTNEEDDELDDDADDDELGDDADKADDDEDELVDDEEPERS
jgi:hypothetical protein